ncbi:MAG: serine hydrolase domain-containing protein [Sphingobacteriaceae bacterium]
MKSAIFLFIISVILPLWVNAQNRESVPPDGKEYFPLPDSLGGWRILNGKKLIRESAGIDENKLDEVFNFIRTTTKNGGLLVVRHGWLVYEKYFGKGQRDATPNLGSCGKSFTSIAVGILMKEHPELFPDGLDQKVFTPNHMPSTAFPLADVRMADIKLGQLLSFSAGIRGNNPVYVNGKPSSIDPIGPDGWNALVDDYALGIKEGKNFSAKTLWCDPGKGYSYSTASAQDASIMLRHIAGMELQNYLETHLAKPLGWGRWGFGYKNYALVNHTPGGGGIALQSTDMLRFCYMLLHEGRWGKQQIVTEEYIHHASKKSPYNPHFPYSLMFDVNTDERAKNIPKDAYWKSGSGNHCFYVVPSLDLIVWKLGGRDDQYSIHNTGLREPKPLKNIIPPIHDKKNHDSALDDMTTLNMVISSIID